MAHAISTSRYQKLLKQEQLEKSWNQIMKDYPRDLMPGTPEWGQRKAREALEKTMSEANLDMAIRDKSEDYKNGFLEGMAYQKEKDSQLV